MAAASLCSHYLTQTLWLVSPGSSHDQGVQEKGVSQAQWWSWRRRKLPAPERPSCSRPGFTLALTCSLTQRNNFQNTASLNTSQLQVTVTFTGTQRPTNLLHTPPQVPTRRGAATPAPPLPPPSHIAARREQHLTQKTILQKMLQHLRTEMDVVLEGEERCCGRHGWKVTGHAAAHSLSPGWPGGRQQAVLEGHQGQNYSKRATVCLWSLETILLVSRLASYR